MNLLRNGLALLGVVRQRLRSHLGLVLAVWAGLTLAVALVVSIPVYAEAAGYRMLLAALAKTGASDQLPPFALIYSYGNGGVPPITWPRYGQVDRLAASLPAAGLDLPVQRVVRYVTTDQFRILFPKSTDEVIRANITFISGFQDNVRLVEGDWPAPWPGAGPIDVLVSESTAAKDSVLVDDVYEVHSPIGSRIDVNQVVRVAGIWRPINPASDFWFRPPEAFAPDLITPESSFAAAFGNPMISWVTNAAWYSVPDFTAVRGERVPLLLGQIDRATRSLDQLLPGVQLTRSPKDALLQHRDQVRLLTVTLALFSVPLLGLLAYFILQVTAMVVQRQQQEIAILRSRGSSRIEVVGLLLGEGLWLSGTALLAGVPLGLAAAQLITWTTSFLRFAPAPGPPVRLLAASWLHGILVLALAIPALLLPALRSSGRTIIAYKQARGRSTGKPFWQRMFLDILLLPPALYGYQQLRLRRGIAVPGIAQAADDPFRNPVLMLAPVLLVFALALLALRLIPYLFGLLLRFLDRLRGVAFLLALRFLVRTPRSYNAPVLLIALTLSLAAFTASMAATLDHHSDDRARYRAGADIRLTYTPTAAAGSASSLGGGPSAAAASADYLLVPVDEYLKVPGVKAVTRAASSTVFVGPSETSTEKGTFLGVDPQTLAGVLSKSWRGDYAADSLGALMNRLATNPAAALIPTTYAAAHSLRTGDRIVIELNNLGETRRVPFVIAGTVDYFPTLYPENGPFVIGNLEYSFEQQGGAYPFDIWLALASGAPAEPIAAEAMGYGLSIAPETPGALLAADRLRPERQGLFGLLSIGFMAAALVTILGFLAHTLLSFQQRLVELGMLRAIGLRTGQLAALLICEQVLVVGAGAGIGTGAGVLASRLFVPFLQVRAEAFPDTPPFLAQIAWQEIALIYGIAGVLLLATVGMTLVLSRRMRLFEVIKLGEAV